jgi:hypothetical protein
VKHLNVQGCPNEGACRAVRDVKSIEAQTERAGATSDRSLPRYRIVRSQIVCTAKAHGMLQGAEVLPRTTQASRLTCTEQARATKQELQVPRRTIAQITPPALTADASAIAHLTIMTRSVRS